MLAFCSEAAQRQTTAVAKQKRKSDTLDLETLWAAAGCLLPTGGSILGPELPECTRMTEDLSVEENGVGHGYSESLSQLREYLAQPSADHTSSSESPVTSSDSGSDISHMPSGDPDCKFLCEKEEAGPAPAMPGTHTVEGNFKQAPLWHHQPGSRGCRTPSRCERSHGCVTPVRVVCNSSGRNGLLGVTYFNRLLCFFSGAEASTAAKASVRLVNFQQSENTSANEKEVEAEFLRLSLGLKCDWFTLEKRVKLEERSRDLAEENLKKEVTNCLKLLESLTPLCEEDNQAQEIIKKLEKSIMFLSQCTTRVASRAEMLGAINQESRVSKAVEVMIQHVENLKRMYAKEHAELEELRQALLHNERSFNSLEDEDDCQIKKRSSSLNSKPSSLRRVTIASLPRNLGNVAMVSGMENSDRFSRRPSSWRILGTEQSEHRPSLHRFISTYAWADAEDEKRDKTRDTPEQAGEEAVERARKPSLSDRRSSLATWDISTVCGSVASWVARLQASFPRFNRVLWLSVVFTVLCAALVSFLTSQLFQTAVEAAPAQEGDTWMSLEQVLWPLTGLRHNGPPPL
ncbi:inositol 1,4,5-triphosphate receptor associated 2 [Acomys russatus]|uniref:inositol 1,4,5-triphosphate receptor associated 2 n=1 Tax=Acomys russatus TaxID=60746 RepID=UPI0021E21D6C|nr:inositol 1,4,5-triphosphate receptor associated 2 [Acomys russatus]